MRLVTLVRASALFLLLGLFLIGSNAQAQTLPPPTSDDQMGMQPYQSYHGGDIDVISLTSGTLNLNVPFLTYPQRGKLHLSYSLFYNNQWQHEGEQVLSQLKPPETLFIWGYNPIGSPLPVERSDAFIGLAQSMAVAGANVSVVENQGKSDQINLYYGNWSLQMADGSKHPLGNLGTLTENCTQPNCYFTASGPFETLDATGWKVTGGFTGATGPANNPTPTSIVGPDGVTYQGPKGFEEDPNGNLITVSSGTVTDSLGRQISAPPNNASTSNTDTSECPQPPQVLLPVDHAVLWSVPGPSGNTVQYKFCYAKVAINIAPGVTQYYEGFSGSQMKLQSIVLPNSQTWDFQYNDPGDGSTYNGAPVNYGTLTQVALPTGGTLSYTYTYSNLLPCQNMGRWVASRTVNANDGSGPHTWTYSFTPINNGVEYTGWTTQVNDPLGNYTVHTLNYGTLCSAYENQTQYYQVGGTLLKTVSTTYNSSTSRNVQSGMVNVVPAQITTAWPNGKTSKVTKSYDSGYTYTDYFGETGQIGIYGKGLSEANYDYGQGSPSSSPLRTTKTNYLALSNSTYLTNNLLDAVSSVQILDSGGTQRAYTTYGYDEYALANVGAISTQHDSAPPDGTSRGNQTSVHRWLSGSTVSTTNCPISVSNGYLVSFATYNDTGTVNTSVDSCGTSYTDANHTTSYAYSTNYAGAYPTTITNPKNQQTNHTYDFNTGLMMSTTDPNSQATSFTYDSLWRLASTSYPDGGLDTITRQETTFPFGATLTKAITASPNPVVNYITTNIFDGLGRVTRSQVTSDPQGIAYTVTSYDPAGRKYQVYNPTRCNPPTTNNCGEPTWGYTTYIYDGIGRTCAVAPPDGTPVSGFNCPATQPSSDIFTTYLGNTTTVTDQQVKSRTSQTDGLGRLTNVWEDPNGLNYQTIYTYDALDDLASVAQGGSRNRSFVFDSLKHMTSSTNPEAGTVTYAYDADSNVITKADARSITITYSYDTLNRMTGRTYSNGDPSVSYSYDQPPCIGQSPCYNIGRRTSVSDAGGSESFSYDKMGREWGELRTTNSIPKSTTYTYNLDGSLATLTYPSMRSIAYTYSGAARPVSAIDSANNINYATQGTYAPQGALAGLALGQAGSFAGINFTASYTNRLQPNEFKASSTAGTAMDLSYSFLDVNNHNNGNVMGITNNRDTTRSQSFLYDSLNRIVSAAASTYAMSHANCWGESYLYDNQTTAGGAWGNLTSIGVLSSAYNGCTQESLSVTATANNQLAATGFSYDAAGNMLGDSVNTYGWNAESEIKSAASVNYTYDGDGNRVQKSNGKIYWYGAGTEVLDESDASGNITDEYVFFGGKRVAHRVVSSGSISYYAEDVLGSSRAITTSTGTLCYDADFGPFGGERVVTNTCAQNYKFEGKERDAETGNDDFGARYYTSRLGRWLSADWSSVPAPVPYADLTNPQTLNLYAMVRDNPETFADLDGHTLNGIGPSTAEPIEGACGDSSNKGSSCTTTSSAGQVLKDTVVGAVKETANELIDLAGLVNTFVDAGIAATGSDFRFGQGEDLKATASTPGEKGAMIGTGIALLLVPVGGEAKAGEMLTRFGTEAESAEKLGTQAAAAEDKLGIHGVSVTARPNPNTAGSSALRSDVEKAFNVHNTGKDVYHRTVELAKPVTQAVADAFNSVFGRTK